MSLQTGAFRLMSETRSPTRGATKGSEVKRICRTKSLFVVFVRGKRRPLIFRPRSIFPPFFSFEANLRRLTRGSFKCDPAGIAKHFFFYYYYYYFNSRRSAAVIASEMCKCLQLAINIQAPCAAPYWSPPPHSLHGPLGSQWKCII